MFIRIFVSSIVFCLLMATDAGFFGAAFFSLVIFGGLTILTKTWRYMRTP